MADGVTFALAQADVRPHPLRTLRFGVLFGVTAVLATLVAAIFLPHGPVLTTFGDTLQVTLVATTTFLAFQNIWRTHSRARVFWTLIFSGALLWTVSDVIWAYYEVWYASPVPDVPVVDMLLFLKVVPFSAAVTVAPSYDQDSSCRAFRLLDVFILILYSLYLYVFGVYAYRLLPGAVATYNFHFNLADAIGNQVFMTIAGIALLRSQGSWRVVYRFLFFASACYGLTSDVSNVAIDMGRYYTGSLYDIPLIAALVSFVCAVLAGRMAEREQPSGRALQESDAPVVPASFFSSHLAMLVALSTPLIGFWLLSSDSAPPQLRPFRIGLTLLTILFLTLLLSLKQDSLTTGLFGSLSRLSETYRSIERFKTHLTQSEKLASLGELVAQAAKQIKGCMAVILEASSRLIARPDMESRIQSLAGKIGQYAHRTDLLVENMLHFAQETPLLLSPLEIRPIIERALHLSRIAKLPNVRVEFAQEGTCPPVRGDSNQLLHVFVQLISNAVDVLEESGGGAFHIALRPFGTQLLLEFADTGPGLKEPQRVFEPFYTTKPVGKGTGLGLSTCYGIIQQHEGEISCGNRPEGGAIFTILLPVASQSLPDENKATAALFLEGAQ